MMAESFVLGILVAFFVYEYLGISAGGVVTLGYFALYYQQPLVIIECLIIGVAVWGVLELILRRFVLFGRNKFLLAIAIGFFLRLVADTVLFGPLYSYTAMAVFGYVIPGLIANDMNTQKPVPTLLTILGSVGVLFLMLYGFVWLGVFSS